MGAILIWDFHFQNGMAEFPQAITRTEVRRYNVKPLTYHSTLKNARDNFEFLLETWFGARYCLW